MTITAPESGPSSGRFALVWWAFRALRNETFGFRFDYPLEAVRDAGPRESLRYYVYSEQLFRDAMQMDAEGIPVHRTRTFGPSYNPVHIAWHGLVCLERELRGLDPSGREAFLRQAAWLAEHAQRRPDGAVVWPLNLELVEGGCVLKPPWISSMVQGLAISVLVRAHRLTRRPELLELCLAATKVFEQQVEDGGVRTLERGHALYEEYPCYPLPRVLDGFLFSLLGLYDLSVETGNPAVSKLFTDGMGGLTHMLEFWNYRDRWSWYGKREYLCPTHYHKLNAALLATLARLSSDPVLRARAEAWDPPRRGLLQRGEIRLVYFVTKNLCRLRYRTWRHRSTGLPIAAKARLPAR